MGRSLDYARDDSGKVLLGGIRDVLEGFDGHRAVAQSMLIIASYTEIILETFMGTAVLPYITYVRAVIANKNIVDIDFP